MSKHTLRPKQEELVQDMLAQIGHSNGYLVADEPGAGKTVCGTEFALRAMKEHGWTRILFIALPNTHKQWADRIALQSDGAVVPKIMDGTAKGKANFQAFLKHEDGVYIAGSKFLTDKDWESVKLTDENGDPVWERYKSNNKLKLDKNGEKIQATKAKRLSVYYNRFRAHPLDAIIFDEVQSIASKKAQQRTTIGSIKSTYRAALSGTWFLNKLENQWTVAKWVWPGENPETGWPWIESAHSEWRNKYLAMVPVYGKNGKVLESARGGAIMNVVGEKDPGAFVRTLPGYRRLENEDRVPDPAIIHVEPTPEQAAQIADLEEDMMTWVNTYQGDRAPLVVDMPMTLRMRLRQVTLAELSIKENELNPDMEEVAFAPDAKSSKLAALRKLIDAMPPQPVGILTDSKIGAQLIEARMNAAGYSARAWTGDSTPSQRAALKASFLAGEFKYLIGTIQSMGTGIDGLQTVCSKVVWVSEADGNPALNEQAIARYFRHGRTLEYGEFMHFKLIMRGTVDELGMQATLDKAWRNRLAMNGGVAA